MQSNITPDTLTKIKELLRKGLNWRAISQAIRCDYTSLRVSWRRYINSLTDAERESLRKECGKFTSSDFPKWQKVTECLPEVGQKVLICTTDKRIRVCFFDPLTEKDVQPPLLTSHKVGDIAWKDSSCWFYAEHVTHWMVLPDPPLE